MIMITSIILAAASPVFPNGAAETFDKMLDSLLKGSVTLINPDELQSMIESGREIFILDSRTAEEWETSRLKNAVFTDFESFKPEDVEGIPKSAAIIVYCSVGYRSEKIGEKLLDAGYSGVYNLNGGIFKWVNEGRKVYDSKGETSKIHGFSEEWGKWLDRGEIIYRR